MPERKVIVGSASGLHARPAKLFVEAAGRQPVPVLVGVAAEPDAADISSDISKDISAGVQADIRMVPARSMLSVLSLGARRGTELVLRAEGAGAEAALAALAELLARDLDAEEPADA